ncbi:hypothetical protein GGF38_006222, partial [Coemansia sp. RSA 25]
MALSAANQRPWAKSTRLSEIYADYSARHNSVTPMFKSNALTDASPAKQAQPAAPANASSFVDSLKTSISRSEWPGEWSSRAEHDYSTDRLNDRRISSLILDSSREPSMSLDIEDRAELLLDSQPERTFMAKPANAPSATVSREARSPVNIVGYDNADLYANASLMSPVAASPKSQGSPPGQAVSELLVLRPMSLMADRAGPSHLPNGRSDAQHAFGGDDDEYNPDGDNGYGWKEAALSGYEYGDSATDELHDPEEHSPRNNWHVREESQHPKQQGRSPPPQHLQQQQRAH